MDTIVEDIGEEYVIQIAPDNVAKYKAVGEILKQKRKRLYWTPCTKHCFDLMLEKNFRNQGCFDKNVDM